MECPVQVMGVYIKHIRWVCLEAQVAWSFHLGVLLAVEESHQRLMHRDRLELRNSMACHARASQDFVRENLNGRWRGQRVLASAKIATARVD